MTIGRSEEEGHLSIYNLAGGSDINFLKAPVWICLLNNCACKKVKKLVMKLRDRGRGHFYAGMLPPL